ncbi:hypothetical protein J7K28_06815 [Candidatus Aerophobetes bacterium]|nr:hypothetical protein [Candidatus Aerophobetes bacterium]
MGKVLGKVGKLSVEHFKTSKRKLYYVPLIFSREKLGSRLSEDYSKKFTAYWDEVKNRVDDLEQKVGKVSKIFHELITSEGEKGVEALKEINERSYEIVKELSQKGATFELIENESLLMESEDWLRCLATHPRSPDVSLRISEFYLRSLQKRKESIIRKIDKTLPPKQIGILFIREDLNIELPQDIEVFKISPPVLDDIHSILRDNLRSLR